MYVICAILIAIAAVLLVGVVLIQKSKGGGLAANVNNYNQIMGVRKTTDFVEKATWGLAIFICVLSIITSMLPSSKPVKANALPAIENNAPAQQNQGTPMQTPANGGGGEAPANK